MLKQMSITVCILLVTIACAAGSDHGYPIHIKEGSRYISIAQDTPYLTGRTPQASLKDSFVKDLDLMVENGERVMRVTLEHGLRDHALDLEVHDQDPFERWQERLSAWDQVFALAAERDLYVIPIFTSHGFWHDETRRRHNRWPQNIFNLRNGGVGLHPLELFEETPLQRAFLQWMTQVVEHLAKHDNIYCWEIFSEFNPVSLHHSKKRLQKKMIHFAEKASALIRRHDPKFRPITTALAGEHGWDELWQLPFIDVVQLHSYPSERYNYDLMRRFFEFAVYAEQFNKPIVIGECSLAVHPEPENMDARPRAHVGYRQSMWGALVSGISLSGMFWFHSGYGTHKLDIHNRFPHVTQPVNQFVAGIDFRQMRRLEVQHSETVFGSALGDEDTILAYFRDEECAAPMWPSRPVKSEVVKIEGVENRSYDIHFVKPHNLEAIEAFSVSARDGVLSIPLPEFSEDIALKID